MHPLCQQPLWQAADLGRPLPPEAGPTAVSVCLPTWASVIGYEEGDPSVVNALQAGYPRFRLPPAAVELGARESAQQAATGANSTQSAPNSSPALTLPFPSRAAALRARACGHAHAPAESPQADPFPSRDGRCWLLPAADGQQRGLKLGWRHLGEGLSQRRAETLLTNSADISQEDARQIQAELRGRIAAWYGVEPAWIFLFASGMAAIGAVHRALIHAAPAGRQQSIQLGFPYVDSLRLQNSQPYRAEFLPGQEFSRLTQRILPEPGLSQDWLGLFTEVPTNPLLELFDLPLLHQRARQRGLPLAVDDSVASAALIHALPHADFVTGSLTKWWSGLGNVMGGLVALNPEAAHALEHRDFLHQAEAEAPLAAEDAAVLNQNSQGFAARVERAAATASVIGRWLEDHPAINQVWWSGSPANQTQWRQLRRPGAQGDIPLLSLTLADPARTPDFHDRLHLSKGPSFGMDWSVISPYTLMAHYDELPWVESQGVPRHLLRLSLGQEDPADLIQRFEAALG